MNISYDYDEPNPYWEVAKYAFAIAGGAAVAGGLVAGGFKIAKRGMKAIFKDGEEAAQPVTAKVEEDELSLSDDDDADS